MSTDVDQFINNLKDRLECDQAYTFVGEVLLHVQPYRNFNDEQNEEEKIQQYKENSMKLPDHIFSLGILIVSIVFCKNS